MRQEIQKCIDLGLDFHLHVGGGELDGRKVKVGNIRSMNERAIQFEAFETTYVVLLEHIAGISFSTTSLRSKGLNSI